MNSSETFHLSDIATNLPFHTNENATVFVTDNFSLDFFNHLKKINSTYSFQYGNLQTLADKFDVLIDSPEQLTQLADITSYSKFLNKGGILITALHNESIIQGKHRGTHFLKNTEAELFKNNVSILFNEASGKFTAFNRIKPTSPLNNSLRKFGRILPNSSVYSPYKIIFYKFDTAESFKPYQSVHTMRNRLKRVRERITYKVRNHKVNDTLIKLEGSWYDFNKLIKSILFIHQYTFRNTIAPNIVITPSEGKRKLVISMTYLQIGGVERVMLNLIKGLDRSKFSISLLTTVPSHNEWHAQFAPFVDTIIHIPTIINRHWPEKFKVKYVEEFVIRNEADVLFITNSTSAYEALPKIKNTLPKIAIYDLLHTHGTPQDNDAYLKISMPYDSFITRRVVIDEYLKAYYTAKYPVSPEKILVIYNSLDKETLDFNSKNIIPDELMDAIPSDKTVISFIGRLESDKSPLRLISIAKRLHEESLNASILVIGDGTLKPRMLKESEDANILNDFIYFYGASHSPLPLMARSDLTLLVSNAEGIPMSVLESMSVLTPPIASSVGGVPEIIDDTVDGYLVDINSVETEEEKIELFVNAIKEAINLGEQGRSVLGLAARKKVIDKFSKMSEMYENLFLSKEDIL